MAQQEYAKARLNYLPRVHLVAEYDVDQRRLFGSNADSYTVMALLNFNLFNGLSDLARVRESRAPAAGVVAERRTAVGDLAQPGQILLSLYNPEELQIEGEVNDAYRQAVKVGSPARLTVPAAAWQAELALAEIFPISQTGSRTFKVRTGMIREHPGLVPGMFARLELPLGETRGILIPQAAVLRVGQLSMVQVVVDRAPRLRQVKLGRQLDHRVEVLAGLKPGDQMLLPE